VVHTLGYHLVKSGYGLWLPGDDRGHWSEAWDEQIGYIEPHKLHPGDPLRRRMAEERMQYPAVRLTGRMTEAVVAAIGDCISASAGDLTVVAAAIESTHMHLLIPYSGRDINRTAKWLADQTTKRIHQMTDHRGPVWGKGKWCSYVFDERHWQGARQYIERHNLRHGRMARPYPFIL
jgi:hypothetical protein